MSSVKRFLLLILLLIFTVPAVRAQKDCELQLSGKVCDKDFRDPLVGAHVQLLDSVGRVSQGVVTSSQGMFRLSGVIPGRYVLRVSFIGFAPHNFQLNLFGKTGRIRVDDILMEEQMVGMKEMTVTAQIPEISVTEDTISYHAGSYTVTEGAMVEELLKKLPGVEIDEYGKIKVNGKEVTQILVDGKNFFGNNTEMTLQNLPADIIDRIKVYDRQSDEARISGVDDGNEKTVIDLTVKKDRKKGWFGQLQAGAGTEKLYNGKFNINRFTPTRKLTFITNANNRSKGGQVKVQTGGFNYSTSRKTLETSGNIRLNHRGAGQTQYISSESYDNMHTPFSNRWRISNSSNWNISTGHKLEWKPDTMTTILLQPDFQLSRQSSSSINESASFSGNPYPVIGWGNPLEHMDIFADTLGVNHNRNHAANSGNRWNANISVQYNRKLKKKGRNVSISLRGGGGNDANNRSNYSQIDYYQLTSAGGGDSLYQKMQFYDQKVIRYQWGGTLSYNEPLMEYLNFQASYSFSMNGQSNDRAAYSLWGAALDELGITSQNYTHYRSFSLRDTSQCQVTTNHYLNHDIRMQFRMNLKTFFMTLGVSLRPQKSTTDYQKGFNRHQTSSRVFNIAPATNLRYKFSRHEQLKFTYQGYTAQPDILNLIPDTLDNANPLYIRLGNAGLKPSFTHRTNFSYNKYLPEPQRSYALNLRYQMVQNSVTQRVEYNHVTGGRVSRPENINGNWNAALNFNMNTALSDKRFRINTNTSVSYAHMMGYVYKNMQTHTNKTRSATMQEQLRGSFRNEWLDVGLSAALRYNYSRNTMKTNQRDVYHMTYGLDMHVKLPWNMKISTDVKESSRRGYSDASLNTDEWVWNMQISQSFLKRKAATVSLQCFDILNQNTDVVHQITSSGVRDVRTERISRYFMLNFIYKINRFGGGKSKRK